MIYALVPLPENDFNGSEKGKKRITVSKEEVVEAMERVQGKYNKGLSLPVVRYRTRPQVTEDELCNRDQPKRCRPKPKERMQEDVDDPDDPNS